MVYTGMCVTGMQYTSSQKKDVFYQNAHLERSQVNVNKLAMIEELTTQRNTGKDSLMK